jgi:hypothetical protein
LANEWQELDSKTIEEYKQKAQNDMQRYRIEMTVYKEQKMLQQQQKGSDASGMSTTASAFTPNN